MNRILTHLIPIASMFSLLMAGAAEAKTGVVFIHGKGGATLADESVARAYWTEDMIRATTKGNTIPSLVCHYDGTQYMWVAGNTVAGQINTWATANAITDIVVETHSFGGVVIRWILSNPTYAATYQPVMGTPLAAASTSTPSGLTKTA